MTPEARLRLTRQALQAKARRGERVSRRPPWGWRVSADGVHLEEAPAEVATLARARELHTAGAT